MESLGGSSGHAGYYKSVFVTACVTVPALVGMEFWAKLGEVFSNTLYMRGMIEKADIIDSREKGETGGNGVAFSFSTVLHC